MSRVLIVEDEGPIRNLLLTVCTREGLEAHAADSAEEAMAECTARGFDLVVTDVNMPGADGHDLACWIAARYPQTRVILMSGFDPGACSRCPYVNKCVLVPKPLDLPRFLALVRDVLAAPPRPLL